MNKKSIGKLSFKICCSLLFVAAFAGCATSSQGPRFSQIDNAPPDKGVIYFYRCAPETWVKSQQFRIYINGEQVGLLPYGCYFKCAVNPGKTIIVSDNKKKIPQIDVVEMMTKKRGTVELDVAPGNTYFIQLQATNNFTYLAGNLSVEEQETALRELQNTTLAP